MEIADYKILRDMVKFRKLYQSGTKISHIVARFAIDENLIREICKDVVLEDIKQPSVFAIKDKVEFVEKTIDPYFDKDPDWTKN